MPLPVVYVQGFIGHLRFPELRAGLDPSRVISPDLLGFGEFAHRLPRSVADQVEHLERQISERFGDAPVLLVGHSGGAAVCVRFAQAWPGRVAGLVSAEGNLAPSDAFLSSRLAPMSGDAIRAWLEKARANPAAFVAQERMAFDTEQLARLEDWLAHQSAEAIHAMARALLVETVHPGYAMAVASVMASVPTYLIQGAKSVGALGVPPRLVAMAAGTITIPGAGHLMVLEAPEAVAAAVVAIIKELS